LIAFILRRLLQAIGVLLGVSLVTFLLLHLTGDPVGLLLPPDATLDDQARLRSLLGLDSPLPVQFVRFLLGVIHGDFGQSIRQSAPALKLVTDRLPATLQLAAAAMALAILVALPAGILAGFRRDGVFDQVAMGISLIGQSAPSFWLGIMLILVFAVQLGWLPASGVGGWQNLVLPAFTLSTFSMARTARLVRSGMIEVLAQDFIRTARAKGLAESVILRRHALRHALVPVVTVLGLDLAHLLGGAVIVETIFAWPGIGRLTVASIGARDYPVVQAAVFLVASGYVLVNFLVDVAYAALNPQLRYR
jgi:peptide/nickel transport system permease protein